MRLHALLAAAALAVALGPAVTAQVFATLPEASVRVDAGARTASSIAISNPTDREYFGAGLVEGPLAPYARLEPAQVSLGPRSTSAMNLTIQVPADTRRGAHDHVVRLTLVDRASGATFDRELHLQLIVDHPAAYLGLFPNLLPAPMHDGWGLFAAEVVSWAVLSFLTALLVRWIVARVAPYAGEAAHEHVASRVRGPVWYLVFVLGLNYSWRLVPPGLVVAVLDRVTNIVAVVVAALLVYRFLTAMLVFYGRRHAEHPGDRTTRVLMPLLEKLVAVFVVLAAVVYGLRLVGLDLSVLLAGSVVIGLVLSLALQDTLSNFFSGIFLLADRPFREGDEIRLETGDVCRVDRIGLRSTRLFHFRHDQEMVVPNNELASKRVVNMSRPDRTYRLHVELEVAYGADLRDAVQTVMDVARKHPDVLSIAGKEPVVWLREFGASGILMQLRVYIPSSRHRNPVRTALMMEIKTAFDAKGIEIPFPQRDLWLRTKDDSSTEP